MGFSLAAKDGEIGHVTDLLLNMSGWNVRDFAVKTGNWFGGHEVMIPVGKVSSVDYTNRQLSVALTKKEIESAKEYHAPKK